MADSYLSISLVAGDAYMNSRVRACAAQQGIPDDGLWTTDNAYRWASSPTWGEKWDYALATHEGDPEYSPGTDTAVISDEDILATVQALTP
jgi:hypothetical protein